MRLSKKLGGLFWSPPPLAPGGTVDDRTSEPSDDVSDEALEALATEAAAKAARTPPSVAAAPTGSSDPPATAVDAPPVDVDFAAIYAKTDSAGDPKVDQVLTAFEAMKPAMPAPQLAVAVSATAKAIGADPSAIVATLTRRLTALDTVVAEERRTAAERETTRNAELEATTKKVHMEIDAMEQRCAAFRRELAAATERVQHKTAGERGVIAAFGAKARGEADRLQALRDFLAPPGAATPVTPATPKATATRK
jgi:hypothetical protein